MLHNTEEKEEEPAKQEAIFPMIPTPEYVPPDFFSSPEGEASEDEGQYRAMQTLIW